MSEFSTNRYGGDAVAQSEAHDTVGELIAQMQRHIISEKAVLERYRTLARDDTRRHPVPVDDDR